MAIERLQKALARAGVASRRKIEELIGRRRVTINGEIAQLGDKVDLEIDSVKVDGKRIQPLRRPQLYLLLNKPPGYVSTVNDPENRPTVLDLLPERLHKALFPVGRLDYDSEGLLLLTTDGDFAQKVAHPSSGCTKLYEVKVKGHPDAAAMVKLHKGIVLDGRHAAPAWVESFGGPPGRRTGRDNSWYRVALKEGRTRQIREMFFRIGHPVMRLKRTQIGGLTDPYLRSGSWRELEPAEIEILLSGIEPARKVERSRGRPKVKIEEAAEPRVKAARPVRRRITAPLPEDGVAVAAPAKTRPTRPAKPAAREGRVASAAPAERPTRPATSPRPRREEGETPRRRRREEEPAEEWHSSPPPRQERRLFEEAEFADRGPSLFYGELDDDSWDEPIGAPGPAAGGRRAAAAAERPRRTARVGRPPGRPAGGEGRGARPTRVGRDRPGAEEGRGRPGRPPRAGRPAAGDERPPRAGRPGARPAGRSGEEGPAYGGRPAGRPARPAGRAGSRPSGEERAPYGARPAGRPARPGGRAGSFEEERPRGPRTRSPQVGEGPARPARPPRPRNGAGRGTPPAGRPGGGGGGGARPSRPGGGGKPRRGKG